MLNKYDKENYHETLHDLEQIHQPDRSFGV